MPDLTTYTIGWVCAVRPELVAALALLDDEHQEGVGDLPFRDANTYTLGRMGKHNIVIAILPKYDYGTTNAASVCNNMIRTFPNLRFCLMVGVGGGAPTKKHDIRLGDIVVSAPDHGRGGVFQYDYGKTMQDKGFEPTGSLNQPPTVLLTAVHTLEAKYVLKGRHFISHIASTVQKIDEDYRAKYSRPKHDRLYQSWVVHGDMPCCEQHESRLEDEGQYLTKRVVRAREEPTIHFGLIASGNSLMKDAKLRDKLATEHDVLCFEMEAAGLMKVFPTLVVRGICDYSDSHKNQEWQGFAAMAAAVYAKDLLGLIEPEAVKSLEKLGEQLSRIESLFESQQYSVISDWLSDVDFNTLQRHYSRKCQPGTGQWFLNSPEFQNWSHQPGQVLICSGSAGSGKSVLMSTVVNYLKSRNFGSETAAVAYAYCSIGNSKPLTFENLISGLLKQFSHGKPPYEQIEEKLKAVYEDRHNADDPRVSQSQIDDLLKYAVKVSDRFFLIIDDADLINEMCTFVSSLQELTGLSLMLTFQNELNIPSIPLFTTRPLRIELSEENMRNDIDSYIEGRLGELPASFRENARLRAYIKSTIGEKSYGRFSLAPALFVRVKNQPSPKRVRAALNTIRSRPGEPLRGFYESAMDRIDRSEPGTRELAYQALCWTAMIFDAPCGLTVAAFQHALAVEKDYDQIDSENFPDLEQVVASVPEFLDRIPPGGRVRLRNDFMHGFFKSTKHAIQGGNITFVDRASGTDAYMTSVCVLYLERCLRSSAGVVPSGLADQFPFHFYANRWWAHHARCWTQERDETWDSQKQASITSLRLSAAKLNQKMYDLITAYDCMGNSRGHSSSSVMEALSEAAFYGLADVVEMMLERGYLEKKAEPTPLLAAFEGTHVVLTQQYYRGQLYSTEEDEDDKADKMTKVFNRILRSLRYRGAFINIKGNDKSALSSAIAENHKSLTHILRSHDAKEHVNESGGVKLMNEEKNGNVPLGRVVRKVYAKAGEYRSDRIAVVDGDHGLHRTRGQRTVVGRNVLGSSFPISEFRR